LNFGGDCKSDGRSGGKVNFPPLFFKLTSLFDWLELDFTNKQKEKEKAKWSFLWSQHRIIASLSLSALWSRNCSLPSKQFFSFLNAICQNCKIHKLFKSTGFSLENFPGVWWKRQTSPTDQLPSLIEKKKGEKEKRKKKKIPVVIVRNRSWPAVSQICSLIRFPSSSMVLILKSILHQEEWQWELVKIFKNPTLNTSVQLRCSKNTHPMVVIKLVVKEPSEKRKRRQLLPTPAKVNNKNHQTHLIKS
jgi:hypothetical protein